VKAAHANKLTIGIYESDPSERKLSGKGDKSSSSGKNRRSRRRGGLPPPMPSNRSGRKMSGSDGRNALLDSMVSFDGTEGVAPGRTSVDLGVPRAKRVGAVEEDEYSFVYGTSDPIATVAGITPMHARSRLVVVG